MITETELKIPTDQALKDYQWGVISALVGGYMSKNRYGEFTVWGILADAYDKSVTAKGSLRHEVIKNNLGMRAAIERLHIGGMLIGIACDLFIRHDGKATDGE